MPALPPPPPRPRPASDLLHLGRGFLMGGADIIPGVSGGTVALILGIYERLVGAISRFDTTLLGHLKRRRLQAAAEHCDLRFLVALGSGIALGIISLASLMHYLLEHQRQHTFAVFFGLILASSYLVGRMISRWYAVTGGLILVAIVFAYGLVGLVPAVPPAGNLYVFLCGVVAICAMILPGISGAFILLILGKYDDITGLLRGLLHGEITLAAVTTVATFCAGCVIGLLSFSKLLKWLLARYESSTMAVLCGFMIGSLRRIWPFQRDLMPAELDFKRKTFAPFLPDMLDASTVLSLVLMLGAAALVIGLDRLTRTSEAVRVDPPLSS